MIAIGESRGVAHVECFAKLCQPLFGKGELGVTRRLSGALDELGYCRDFGRVDGADHDPEERLEVVMDFVLLTRRFSEAKVRGVAQESDGQYLTRIHSSVRERSSHIAAGVAP